VSEGRPSRFPFPVERGPAGGVAFGNNMAGTAVGPDFFAPINNNIS